MNEVRIGLIQRVDVEGEVMEEVEEVVVDSTTAQMDQQTRQSLETCE